MPMERIRRLEKQIAQLLDRIVEASNDSVVAAHEKRSAKLEREKVLALEKLSEPVRARPHRSAPVKATGIASV